MSKRALANIHAVAQARAEARVPYAAAIQAREDVLLGIQELLDGVEWTPATLEAIAQLMVNAGYRIRDLDDVDREAGLMDEETVLVPLTKRELRALILVTQDKDARPPGVIRWVWSDLYFKLMQAARTMP